MSEPNLATTEDWCVFAIDETAHWNLPVWVPAGTRIEGVYLTDRSRAINLCEMTRSYECWSLFSSRYLLPEGVELTDEQGEEFYDFIREGDALDEPVSYWHCHDLDRRFGWVKEDRGPTWVRLHPEFDNEELAELDEEEAYHKKVDQILEEMNEGNNPLQ